MTDLRQTADPEICAQWDWCPYCKNGLDTGLQCDQCLADLMPVQEALRELQRLRSSGGASENAVRRSEYWKGEYLAANAFINRMEAQNAELRAALFAMMQAFERRARSACQSTEEIEKQPWRCLEYVAAEEVLKLERSLPLLFSNEALREAEAFVDRHSEPWYTSGQELLVKIRAALGDK